MNSWAARVSHRVRRYAGSYREPAWLSTSRSSSSQIPVLKPPGSTRITLTPDDATSIRVASVSASSACFDAWYQPVSGVVNRP